MKIAVLGGGNGAYAAAVDLTEQGHEVNLWRRNEEAFQIVLETKTINVKDFKGNRTVTLANATTNLKEAIQGVQLIVIPLPAVTQSSLAKQLAPILEDGQVIFLPPGTFGSYLMSKVLVEEGCKANVMFAETGTLPYLARKHDEETVSISGRGTRLPTGVFPSNQADYAFRILKEAFPAIEENQDALDGALMNAGPIIHPPLILMNAGPIEHFDKWDIHDEGTQPAIRNVHRALDAERISIREALGYTAPHFPLEDHYNHDGDEWMYGNGAHEKLVDGHDWHEPLNLYHHRYMREDVACGLAFLVSLGEWLKVPVPVASGLLAIASSVIGEELRKKGRTMENLGLSHKTVEQVKEILEKGVIQYEIN
ncbi:opine dehydrogenase [Neobacillus niacini]|uniref:NAD/NADP octopine/nopaline dehydrogenase family protein n=1 Tax=Neobacillus niacini TaxID=86668 RepID=UPI00278A3721|nr:NAD/NADP octopine/nopaline dehydrogenase family protein [Neobacillus niacini]MDQ1003543.1 opine dehydrogenase [Neobacillus niacini]